MACRSLSLGSSVKLSTPNIFGAVLPKNGAWDIAPTAAHLLSRVMSSVPGPKS
jgi:hypothetical protein